MIFNLIIFLLFSLDLKAQEFHVWSEFLDLKKVKNTLPFLHQKKVKLHLAINQNDFINPEKEEQFIEVITAAKKEKVLLYLWPLIDEKNGYWLNSSNIDQFTDYVYKLIFRLKELNLDFEGISFDLEPAPEFTRSMLQFLKKLQIKKAIHFLNQHCDNEYLNQQFQKKLTALIFELEQEGIKTHIVTTPFVLEDLKKGQNKIQNIFGIPLAFNASEYSFMAYSTDYESFMGPINSYPVYQHGIFTKKFFPHKKVGLDLGVIGEIEFPVAVKGYKKIQDLKGDIQAARAAGIDQIHFYSLEGILSTKSPASWFAPQKAKRPVPSLKWKLYNKLQDSIYAKLCL